MNGDIHIHTHLSNCGSRTEAFIPLYTKAARELGMDYVGFSDHSWDSNVKGCSPWYAQQDYVRLASRRLEAKGNENGIKIIYGAEGEFANFLLGITENALQFVDYIIVPHSHTHMKGFVLPADCEPLEKHKAYLLKSFHALLNHKDRNLFFGICHPFKPVGMDEETEKELFSLITDSELDEAFCHAKERGVFVEVNASAFAKTNEIENYCYSRVIASAKRCGAELFWGSDAHSVGIFKALNGRKTEIMNKLSLVEDDFKAAERRILSV